MNDFWPKETGKKQERTFFAESYSGTGNQVINGILYGGYDIDDSYDVEKLIIDGDEANAEIENQISTRIAWGFLTKEEKEIFSHKTSFSEWLKTQIDYEFTIRNINEQVSDNYGIWLIEFHASKEEVDEIIKTLDEENPRLFYHFPRRSVRSPDASQKKIDQYESIGIFSSEESLAFGDFHSYVSGIGGWYLKYIGMEQIYEDLELNSSQIKVGVIDNGVLSTHVDMYSNISYLGPQRKMSHGTAVLGAFSGAIIGNGVGTRAIINTDTIFVGRVGNNSFFGDELLNFEENLLYSHPRVVNMSIMIPVEYSYTKDPQNFNEWSHINEMYFLRELAEEYPETLFVLAAGNNGTDAIGNNGGIHYVINPSTNEVEYSPLDNVIVVGSVDIHSTVTGLSDYGESVDIVAPSGYMALACNEDGNGYYKAKDEISYGDNQYDAPDSSPYDNPDSCSSRDYHFHGTSASAPLVSGGAAILLTKNPDLTPKEVKNYLLNSGRSTSQKWVSRTNKISISSVPILHIGNSYDELKSDMGENADSSDDSSNPSEASNPEEENFDIYSMCELDLDSLENVDFTFVSSENQPTDVRLSISDVSIYRQFYDTWVVGDMYRVSGIYSADTAGEYYVHFLQDYGGSSSHKSCGYGDFTSNSGAFDSTNELSELNGEIFSKNIKVRVCSKLLQSNNCTNYGVIVPEWFVEFLA